MVAPTLYQQQSQGIMITALLFWIVSKIFLFSNAVPLVTNKILSVMSINLDIGGVRIRNRLVFQFHKQLNYSGCILYGCWLENGVPIGSPAQDWSLAVSPVSLG